MPCLLDQGHWSIGVPEPKARTLSFGPRPWYFRPLAYSNLNVGLDERFWASINLFRANWCYLLYGILVWSDHACTKQQQCHNEKPPPTRVQRPTPAMFLWFVTLIFDSKINWFPGLILEHFCVSFGGPSCSGFWDIVQRNRQPTRQRHMHRQTDTAENPTPASIDGVGN